LASPIETADHPYNRAALPHSYRTACDLCSRPLCTDFHESWHGYRDEHVVIYSNFGFNGFRGFRSTGGSKFPFPIEFAGHHYNSVPLPRSL